MRVRAIAKGTYNGLRAIGDEFTLRERQDAEGDVIDTPEDQFSSRWMEKLDASGNVIEDEKKPAKKRAAAKPRKSEAEKVDEAAAAAAADAEKKAAEEKAATAVALKKAEDDAKAEVEKLEGETVAVLADGNVPEDEPKTEEPKPEGRRRRRRA